HSGSRSPLLSKTRWTYARAGFTSVISPATSPSWSAKALMVERGYEFYSVGWDSPAGEHRDPATRISWERRTWIYAQSLHPSQNYSRTNEGDCFCGIESNLLRACNISCCAW